jgi:hypothetical protein
MGLVLTAPSRRAVKSRSATDDLALLAWAKFGLARLLWADSGRSTQRGDSSTQFEVALSVVQFFRWPPGPL